MASDNFCPWFKICYEFLEFLNMKDDYNKVSVEQRKFREKFHANFRLISEEFLIIVRIRDEREPL